MALNGWHIGERAVRAKLHFDEVPATATLYMSVSGDLPRQHAEFHTTRLPFLPVTILDEQGRPWGSILAGHEGKPGFISEPTYNNLAINAALWDGDPFLDNARLFSGQKSMLVAGIGIEFPTRRRNKLAGHVTNLEQNGKDLKLKLVVDEAIGNCPKYINVRDLIAYPNTSPQVVFRQLSMNATDRLPDEVISFILEADTVFIGSTYDAPAEEATRFPSHLGMNQRGGRPGFIRVVPSDGRTVILPDYSGNRIMTSLGNIEATPLASFTFVSFTTGDVLYLTGDAKNLFGSDAKRLMALQNALTAVYVTGFVYVRDALPVRQRPGTQPERSPYSPPIKRLVEETPESGIFGDEDKVTALLTRIDLHHASIATFTWELSRELNFTPGQAIVLDVSRLVGAVQYQHMAAYNPASVNDDRIRTWTVSSSHPNSATRTFSLTIRHKPGGAITTALFMIAHKLAQLKPEALADSRPLQCEVDVVGVSGEFVLPASTASTAKEQKLLWIAGGIGFTPFLSMLRSLRSSPNDVRWDIRMVLSTREPEVLLRLISDAFEGTRQVQFTLYVFSKETIPDINGVTLHRHTGRLDQSFFEQVDLDLRDREVYLCGPDSFEKMASGALVQAGVPPKAIKKEGFEY